MNTNDAYQCCRDCNHRERSLYMTAEDGITATQNVAYGQIPPETDDCYDYVI